MITPAMMVARMRAKNEELCSIHDKASKEYASDQDALANFKRRAIESGCTPLQAWHLYAGKHWDGISSFIRGHTEQREAIEGRFDDLLVYLHLGLALLSEERALRAIIGEEENYPGRVIHMSEERAVISQAPNIP